LLYIYVGEIIHKIRIQHCREIAYQGQKSRVKIFREKRTHFFFSVLDLTADNDKDNVLLSGTVRSRRYANDIYLDSPRE